MLSSSHPQKKKDQPIVLVIHGGAGNINQEKFTAEKQQVYKAALDSALDAGYAVLETGGTALDAVETAIRMMEDNPFFNAGKGAVFTNQGKNELDASIMDGKTRNAGAVAVVTTIKNPITAARAVMEKSEHVMLIGKGAELFADEVGLQKVDPSYFYTEKRMRSLEKMREKEQIQLDHSDENKGNDGIPEDELEDHKFGTVGAVALDKNGNLAAGTSTGGMTNKKYGRVGDSPIIGAGTYADNNTCAISATGHGEYFIRYVVAYDITALMKYKKMPLKEATKKVIQGTLKEEGGDGGVIAVDKKGNISMEFNTTAMFRAYKSSKGEQGTAVFK